VREIRPGVSWVGALDWDRRMFDELIPLPDGTTYNAYLVKGGAKTALIDTVDPTREDELVGNLAEASAGRIDYVVCSHAEQDHSGSIPRILRDHPGAKVIATPKCAEMIREHLLISADRIVSVNDGDTVSLGDRTLRFIHMPWVHWPETMVTLLEEDGILFTCDLFGSHLAGSDLYASDEGRVLRSAKRYYAEIMMPFRGLIRGHLGRLRGFRFGIIAPSHGPVYDRPRLILDAYEDWVSDRVKNEAVVAYASMHGSTKRLVDRLVSQLISRGVTVRQHNLPYTDIGELAMDLVDAATLVVATPTVLAGPHPAAVYAAYLANALRPKTRYAAVIGSYGWGGRAVETIGGMLGNLKVEVLPPVMAKGLPKDADYAAVDSLAGEISKRHAGI
jgi:flavorubredoxin